MIHKLRIHFYFFIQDLIFNIILISYVRKYWKIYQGHKYIMLYAPFKKNTSSNSILWPTPKGSAMIDIIFSYSLLRLADVLAVIRHFLFDKNI